jgi:mxaJ protein
MRRWRDTARGRPGIRTPALALGLGWAPAMTALAMTALAMTALAMTARAMTAPNDPAAAADRPVLSVCADPANLPYSNRRREGFENRIALLLADDLGADLRYVWFAEHRVFLRRTLLDGLCDVVISVPTGLRPLATTRPYFVSYYVAVTRTGRGPGFGSFDDAWLRDARIGLQLVGAEGATTPPALALARRGPHRDIIGFPMWAGDDTESPQGRIVDAVADGTIDVAMVWGPFAGYFARPHGDALRLDPIRNDPGDPDLPFVFPMAVGVRASDVALRDRLQAALDRHAADIASILRDFAIPTLPISDAAAPTVPHPPTAH